MAKASGRKFKILKLAINTRVSISLIRKMVKGSSNGSQEMYIKELIKMMKEKATEKCFG